jgi:very-short-patch-repair endonuclease
VLTYGKQLKPYTRKLRKEMTNSELYLWSKIRMKQLNGYQFYRQRSIDNYIVDFFCPKAKLIIEVDGGQHYSDAMVEQDHTRDQRMMNLGFNILRFTNTEVLTNIDGVVSKIVEKLPGSKENPP